jgi:hypothetical protein
VSDYLSIFPVPFYKKYNKEREEKKEQQDRSAKNREEPEVLHVLRSDSTLHVPDYEFRAFPQLISINLKTRCLERHLSNIFAAPTQSIDLSNRYSNSPSIELFLRRQFNFKPVQTFTLL